MNHESRQIGSFYPLFVLLLISLAFTVGVPKQTWAVVVGQALAAASLLLTLRAVRVSRGWMSLGWIVLVVGFAGALLQGLFDIRALRAIVGVIYIVLLFASVPLILRRLASHRQVTAETIVGSLCAYLLIGMDFAVLQILNSAIEGHSVIMSAVTPDAPITRGDFYYHSFITMTTVGYGDFVPVTGAARTLVLLEGVLGQLFLVTVVARLVSVATIRRSQSAGESDARTEEEVEGSA